jgi:hypothetical protein
VVPLACRPREGRAYTVREWCMDGDGSAARARGFHREEWLAAATAAAQLGLSPSATWLELLIEAALAPSPATPTWHAVEPEGATCSPRLAVPYQRDGFATPLIRGRELAALWRTLSTLELG